MKLSSQRIPFFLRHLFAALKTKSHILVRLDRILKVLDFYLCFLEHAKTVFLIVVMLFADNALYAAVYNKHSARHARRHLAVHSRAVD